ncbi:MAG TPA: HlyD family efflux transporter periplasmic adaptor subunit [Steroidobacteraceae bacterium]|nr:HlyD family efflux transporter periplasmic adaptor subunit [Steroidobacteraceae bacterium]
MDRPRTDGDRRRRKRWLLAGGGLLAVASAGLALATLEPLAPTVDGKVVFIDTVQRGEFVRRVRGAGLLVPRDQRWIAASSEGRVERVLLRPGVAVSADDVLVELSNPELEQLAEEARWALDAGRAELAALRIKLESDVLDQRARIAEARADHESARLQAEAEGRLAGQKIISDLQLARSRLTAEQLGVRLEIEQERLSKLAAAVAAQVQAQNARVEQLERTCERRRAQVDALKVRAGLDGVLQALAVEAGQQLAVGASIARVARPGSLRAELRIPEIDAKDLSPGQRVTIDTRNGIVAGHVEQVEPAVQNGTVKVEAALDGELPAGARADLSIEGTVEIERLADVMHVARPVSARPLADARLFRVDNDGTARRVPVKLGKASVDRIVVLAGLAPGERVIVSDVAQYARYDRLNVE